MTSHPHITDRYRQGKKETKTQPIRKLKKNTKPVPQCSGIDLRLMVDITIFDSRIETEMKKQKLGRIV